LVDGLSLPFTVLISQRDVTLDILNGAARCKREARARETVERVKAIIRGSPRRSIC
jgi:hypothetical protein